MTKENIIKVCQRNKSKLAEIIKSNPYEPRGILNSELLLVISLIKEFELPLIIESGRARGHSTDILSRFFRDANREIISIDFDQQSKDAKYSERRLKDRENLQLVYGDSNEIIPNLIDRDCAVIIDGPKGEGALILALKLLKNPKVKLVFVHDLHQNTFARNIAQILFPMTFFSDDKDYVDKFSDLDNECWEKVKKYNEAPYHRKGKKFSSYASTIMAVFNNEPVNSVIEENYWEYYKSRKKYSFKKLIASKFNKQGAIYKFFRQIELNRIGKKY